MVVSVVGAGKSSNEQGSRPASAQALRQETGNSNEDAANAASLAFRLGMADPPPSRDLPTLIIAMQVQITPSGTIGQNMSGLTRCAPQGGGAHHVRRPRS